MISYRDSFKIANQAISFYKQRTLKNVLDSDGTVIIYFDTLSRGTEKTLEYCITHHKPYFLIDAIELTTKRASDRIRLFIIKNTIKKLNIAGPRASQEQHAYHYSRTALTQALKIIQTD